MAKMWKLVSADQWKCNKFWIEIATTHEYEAGLDKKLIRERRIWTSAGISLCLDIYAVFYALFSTVKNEKTAWYLRLL